MPFDDTARRRGPRLPRVTRTCEVCAAVFLAKPSLIARGGGRFCSVPCRDESQRTARPVEIRLWDRVDKNGPIPPHRPEYGGCWLWIGKLNPSGYGRIYRHFPDAVMTHRLAWEIATGETLTSDDVIGHICDVPRCIRNDDMGTYEVRGVLLPRCGHLFKGTDADNVADMMAKDRHWRGPMRCPERFRRGSAAAQAKLTEEAVRQIRSRYAAGGILQSTLASEYGVKRGTISDITWRNRWKHIE